MPKRKRNRTTGTRHWNYRGRKASNRCQRAPEAARCFHSVTRREKRVSLSLKFTASDRDGEQGRTLHLKHRSEGARSNEVPHLKNGRTRPWHTLISGLDPEEAKWPTSHRIRIPVGAGSHNRGPRLRHTMPPTEPRSHSNDRCLDFDFPGVGHFSKFAQRDERRGTVPARWNFLERMKRERLAELKAAVDALEGTPEMV